MDISKKDKIIMALLANIQVEILTLKDFVLTNIAPIGSESRKQLDEIYEKTRILYHEHLTASIKNGFDDKLGSIDDLLNSL